MSAVSRVDISKGWRTVLTNAQIKALAAPPPIIVVPAQGAGRIIVPVLAIVELKWVADYTNINAAAVFNIANDNNDHFGLVRVREAAPFGGVSSMLANGGSSLSYFSGIASYNGGAAGFDFTDGSPGWNPANFDNLPLEAYISNGGAGALTGGDPGNSMAITVFYNVVRLL